MSGVTTATPEDVRGVGRRVVELRVCPISDKIIPLKDCLDDRVGLLLANNTADAVKTANNIFKEKEEVPDSDSR